MTQTPTLYYAYWHPYGEDADFFFIGHGWTEEQAVQSIVDQHDRGLDADDLEEAEQRIVSPANLQRIAYEEGKGMLLVDRAHIPTPIEGETP